MASTSHAVFLSYASEDAEAAQRIAGALRAAGVEIWFDQTELRGGDTWDRNIRDQIHQCRLFIPIISMHSEARDEGYFRREWKLAVDRTHDMAEKRAFLVPVVIDDTPERGASVPDKFRDVQWTRLPGGETSPTFVEQVRQLLSPQSAQAPEPTRSGGNSVTNAAPTPRTLVPHRTGVLYGAIAAGVAALAVGYLAIERPWIAKPATGAVTATMSVFAPPPHSVAVLPFVNMSGDKEQEYFSDGLTEELLNSLASIDELQVAARTSAFSFKGQNTDIAQIAHKLNVGAILEGSVRRSGHTIRISAELINAVTGFQLWSKSYDRDLGDMLKLQTEIATAVAGALKVTLLGDIAQKIEVGGTRNPAALDAYLRASTTFSSAVTELNNRAALKEYTEAIRLDPEYAIAYADRSWALIFLAEDWLRGNEARDFSKAGADARRAIALAPGLAKGHLALAEILTAQLDYRHAIEEFERARALAPGNAQVLGAYGHFATLLGRTETGLIAARRAVILDPLNGLVHSFLGEALFNAGRYVDSAAALRESLTLVPDNPLMAGILGTALIYSGDVDGARVQCESIRPSDNFNRLFCLAIAYQKLGRQGDAQAAFDALKAGAGDDSAPFFAWILAEWGAKAKALDWLELALRQRDPYLFYVKTQFKPLRQEPRFQAIERELKFPD